MRSPVKYHWTEDPEGHGAVVEMLLLFMFTGGAIAWIWIMWTFCRWLVRLALQ